MSAQPTPIIRQRAMDSARYQKALDENWPELLARVIAGRPAPQTDASITDQIEPSPSHLACERDLADIGVAARRLAMAVVAGECIAIETDHDVDGVTAHCVIKATLQHHLGHAQSMTQSYIGHRLREGYGLSDPVVDRMLAASPRPQLVVTADNGSADEARIARLREHDIDVIVTDHHEIPVEGIPQSALAVINPTRDDCGYGDRCIAGCMVAWLLMRATVTELQRCGYLENALDLNDLLDFVALGTMADCVSLARSLNNRWVVREGLKWMNRRLRPCWRAVEANSSDPHPFTEQDLGWVIGPRINARGRLDDAMAGVAFLLAPDDGQANGWWGLLERDNHERKRIETGLKHSAMCLAQAQVESKCHGLGVFLSDGHPGVHGIVASRVVEAFGRPTVCLSPVYEQPERVTGSARSVTGFSVKAALDAIALEHPGLLLKWGGHEGAGGLTIAAEDVERFVEAWDQAVASAHAQTPLALRPQIWSDGQISAVMDIEWVRTLQALGPYGREFEAPVFHACAQVRNVKPVGDGTHLKLLLEIDGQFIDAIWFSARRHNEHGEPDPAPVAVGDQPTLAFTVGINRFRGRESVQLQVLGMQSK